MSVPHSVRGMYPTCRTERGVAQLGSASALGAEGRGFKSRHPDHQPEPDGDPRDPREPRDRKIVFWGVYRLRLLCKLRARVSALLRLSRAANPAEAPPHPAEADSRTQEVSHKETEP